MKATTLRARLTLTLTLILIAVFVGLWIALSMAITKVAQDQLLTHLEHDGDALLAALSFDALGRLKIAESNIEEVYLREHSGHYFVVRTARGQMLKSGSLGQDNLEVGPFEPERKGHAQLAGPEGQSVLALTRGFYVQGETLGITVAENLAEMNDDVREQSLSALGLILPLLLAAVVLQSLSVKRALRPLTGIQVELHLINKGEINEIEGEVPGEIRPLVDEINSLLKVVRRRLMQSRTAVGNLAHALKTPLAVLFRIADEKVLTEDILLELKHQTGNIREKLERELKRARLAGGESFSTQINVREELQIMVRVLQAIYRNKDLSITIEAPEQLIALDREDMVELLGNLADNACKWASSQVAIRVTTPKDYAGIQIEVADDGPGCDPKQAQMLGQRGLRLDENTAGHGLGLAICHDIVDLYTGEIHFIRDPNWGGLLVRVRLPKRM